MERKLCETAKYRISTSNIAIAGRHLSISNLLLDGTRSKLRLVEVGQDDLSVAAWYKEKYPHAMVRMLELEDGTQISDAMAIARYFEEIHPEPLLMGRTPREKAIVATGEKRAKEGGMLPASKLFRNTHEKFT